MKSKLKEIQIEQIKVKDSQITNNFYEVQIKRNSNRPDQKYR